jgi:protoporphyrinogen/coproporphyrinogen III oxidase
MGGRVGLFPTTEPGGLPTEKAPETCNISITATTLPLPSGTEAMKAQDAVAAPESPGKTTVRDALPDDPGMVGIVGAGISGLALGMELRERGVPYRIFERRRTPGGVIRTVRMRGLRLELGPQRIRSSPEMLRRFGPVLDAPGPGGEAPGKRMPVLVARGDRLYALPQTLADGIRTPALSLRGKLRAALWPLMARRSPTAGEISAGDYLRHLAGEEAYRTFLGPLFGGLYGTDPDRMDAHRSLVPALETLGGQDLFSLLGLRGGEGGGLGRHPAVVPTEGMAALFRHLHQAQADAVALGEPVLGLTRRRDGSLDLRTAAGNHTIRTVVLTTPPEPAAHLLHDLAPEAGALLRRLHLNRLVLVHLDVEALPPGLGFQVAFGEGRRIRGATFAGNLDGSGRTAVVYMGGMWEPLAHLAPDPELGRVAAEEFTAITGSRAEPLHVHRVTMPAWDSSWRALDALELPPGIHLLTNYTGRPGIPGRLSEAAALARRLAGNG